MKPLAIDLFCGLGGWTEGLLAAGYDVIGFDNERHEYGEHRYPAQLVLQDVRTLHGKQFKDAALIVASPPCQAYSYRAMPWKRAKALPPPDNTLFEACFRIQREACEAAGRHIPLVVENVRGAQKWVGQSRWHYRSYHLWGDVPALMPIPHGYLVQRDAESSSAPFTACFRVRLPTNRRMDRRPAGEGYKQPGISGPRKNGKGDSWFQDGAARHGSKSKARKAASALIAKIPFELARHIGRAWKP